ncbi:MAG: hypothetical protein QG635_2126 [Bacteroidota bacterium]|nr:hypothetical protein [Bacteroidota bacterium]
MEWKNFIRADDKILLGKPIIKGTRLSVELLLELLSEGWTEKMLLESYPNLTQEAIKAVFSYSKECMQNEMYY